MSPDEESKLCKAIECVGEKIEAVGLKVSSIEATCKSCRADVSEHDVILHGRPGNGNNPGLQSRVLVAEREYEEVAKERKENTKWFRRQLAAVISALLLGVGWTGYNSWDQEKSSPPQIERKAVGAVIPQLKGE